MSHIVIKVYSFECDVPECDRTEDVTAHNLREARRETRGRWTVSNGQDVCPRHSGTERQAVVRPSEWS